MSHQFGSHWTDAKLAAPREYLGIYTTALKRQNFRIVYIDAFAGSGTYTHKSGGQTRDGSATIALKTGGFARYTFIDRKREHVQQLDALKAQFPAADIHVIHGDANEALQSICHAWPTRQRGVAFLDPYGMQATWQTLESIRATGFLDVWYLTPLNGLLRQLTRNPSRRDSDKDTALDKMLGTPDWRTELYQETPIPDLFTGLSSQERVDTDAVRSWLNRRYKTLFPYVEEVALLHKGSRRNPHGGPPLFALHFMMANTAPTAVALARKFVTAVRNKLQGENILAH